MINKDLIQSIISKYYLDMNESVKWNIENNKLTINFTSPSKDLIGRIISDNIPIEDAELSIFDTKKLNNILSVLAEEIEVGVEYNQKSKIPLKLLLGDNKFECIYTLSDPLIIPKTGIVNEPEYDINVKLSSDDINNMIKAKKALSETTSLTIETSKNFKNESELNFIFGDDSDYNNKIIYPIKIESNNHILRLSFNSDYIRLILKSNENCSDAELFLNKNGLLKFRFIENDTISEYFIIKKSDNTI